MKKIILVIIFLFCSITTVKAQDTQIFAQWATISPLTLQIIVGPYDYSNPVDKPVIITAKFTEDLEIQKLDIYETSIDIRCGHNLKSITCAGNRLYSQTTIMAEIKELIPRTCNKSASTVSFEFLEDIYYLRVPIRECPIAASPYPPPSKKVYVPIAMR